MTMPEHRDILLRIAEALERLSPPPGPSGLEQIAEGYLWLPQSGRLRPVTQISHISLDLLQGVEAQRDALLANTRGFAAGREANNALLWGVRGTGKSSLVKSVHAQVNAERPAGAPPLALVEVQREDIGALPGLLELLEAAAPRRFIIFCDDLSFDAGETAYKSLKAVLDGGIAGRPENVVFYATSNRRHVLAREPGENQLNPNIHSTDTVEEKVSLSDRFGLWLGFHATDQRAYLDMVRAYAAHFAIAKDNKALEEEALQWSIQRGSRSGRTAWQFIQSLRIGG